LRIINCSNSPERGAKDESNREQQIDVAGVARQALVERQPGEDLDEALLRSCKKLYGEVGAMTFEAVQSAVTALAQHNKINWAEALQQIANGQAAVDVVTQTQVSHTVSMQSLDDLSPELRAQVEKALSSSGANLVINRTSSGHGVNRSVTRSTNCQACGYEFHSAFSFCPQYGREKKRSFWSRLFWRIKSCRLDP
jgi:hypothetical protein